MKRKFYKDMARGCKMENKNEVLICLEDFNGHIVKRLMGLKVSMEVLKKGKETWRVECS